jgi:DNA repair protein RecN (Recombination protein N)
MLRDLRITNLAIIDELVLSFGPGMNVLTGETGAGKSIIMRAIGLLCGMRASADLIRTDAEEVEVEGLFQLENGAAVLSENGLPAADEVLVRRVINRAGKGRVHINGSLATASVLNQLGSRLIHLYGQHDQALLLRPDSHLDLLDSFGKLVGQREQMARAYADFREVADRLGTLAANTEANRQRLELLQFQADELRQAHVQVGEERELLREREVQRHAEKLSQLCRQEEEALYSGDAAIASALARIGKELHDAARIDPTFRAPADLLQQAAAQVEDVALDLRHNAERIRHDPERLEQIEERLALFGRLKRKYTCDADDLGGRLQRIEAELAALETGAANPEALRRELAVCEAQAWKVARELSRARLDAAATLEKRMAQELRALGMPGGVFQVRFDENGAAEPQGEVDAGRLSALGADTLEFYLSANPGEDPKPLARIASGGELSRIMLALKTLTAAVGEVPTLIFDEVDAGIGGAVAEAVGKRLRNLGRSRQILCITHLPQIAAQADHHFAVEKRVARGRTTTRARALSSDERIGELSRMFGGTATAEAQRYARRLMEGAGGA